VVEFVNGNDKAKKTFLNKKEAKVAKAEGLLLARNGLSPPWLTSAST
jgi:hypothetical protein